LTPSDPQRQQAFNQQVAQKTKALNALLASWKPRTHTSQEATLPWEPEPETLASPDAPTVPTYPASPDGLHYAMILTEINSDEPGPVLAEIVSGPLQGAKLLGKFTRFEDKVVVQFERLTLNQQTTAISALAVDPISYRQGIASHVNRRTFSRWAALIGSALLEGLQRALLAQGTAVGLGYATVGIERDFDEKEIAGIVLGEIGPRTRGAAQQYFNRSPTVTVRAGDGVGILFLEPVAIPLPAPANTAAATP
jgi:hypothetical protein